MVKSQGTKEEVRNKIQATDRLVYIQGADGKPLVEIFPDGNVKVYGDVNEAAKIFWGVVEDIIKEEAIAHGKISGN